MRFFRQEINHLGKNSSEIVAMFPYNVIDDKSPMIQFMAWCQQTIKHHYKSRLRLFPCVIGIFQPVLTQRGIFTSFGYCNYGTKLRDCLVTRYKVPSLPNILTITISYRRQS